MPLAALLLSLVLPMLASAGCKVVTPSNSRDWSPDQAVLPFAEFSGDQVLVHNVRNCTYLTVEDFVIDHHDRQIDLNQVSSVWFIVIPFKDMPSVAHTMMSFGMDNGEHLGVSVEIRKEKNEKYGPVRGFMRQYELMYVLGEESDLLWLCANARKDDVYLYRTIANRDQARALLVDVLGRVNKLYHEPEFYDTLTNNCTNNIARHVNRLSPQRIPYDYRVLLPGYADQLAYDLGLIDTRHSFEETKRLALITPRAQAVTDRSQFSQAIRAGMDANTRLAER